MSLKYELSSCIPDWVARIMVQNVLVHWLSDAMEIVWNIYIMVSVTLRTGQIIAFIFQFY